MPTPPCYNSSDARRFNSRTTAYPSYAERRGVYPVHPESRTVMTDKDGMEEPAPQRKRIAVACGRCRKRKIRCSGDAGNGHPCSNCRNAGFEPCQFLRVASQEAVMVKENSFPYSLEASRQVQARGSSAVVSPVATVPQTIPQTVSQPQPQPVSQYAETVAMPADGIYRPGTSFPYSAARTYYSVSGWPHGISEDAQPVAAYPLYSPSAPYHSLHEPAEYSMNYRVGTGASAAQAKGPNALYVDAEPAYTYAPSSNNTAGGGSGPSPTTTSLVHRPAAASAAAVTGSGVGSIGGVGVGVGVGVVASSGGPTDAAASFGFQNVASGMTASVSNGGERSLPTPVARTALPLPLPPSGASPYRNDSGAASTYSNGNSKGSQSSVSVSGTPPATPSSDATSSYTTYEPSSMSSYTPTSLASQFSRPDSLYSTAGSSDGLYSSSTAMRSSGSAPELQYRYTDTTTRRDSTSSAAGIPGHSRATATTFVPQAHHAHAHAHTHHHAHAHAHAHASSYMLPGEVGAGGAAEAPAGDRKPVVRT